MKWSAAIFVVGVVTIVPLVCEAEVAGREPAKTCQEIAQVIATHAVIGDQMRQGANMLSVSPSGLNCAGAAAIPSPASLQLTKTIWNRALQRWEFTLRCARPQDCVPFLVWAPEKKDTASRRGPQIVVVEPSSAPGKHPGDDPGVKATEFVRDPLVRAGQSVTLTWEQRGIRVILPATCLDAGGMGQSVRVRLHNAPGILRAEVVGKAMLRASL